MQHACLRITFQTTWYSDTYRYTLWLYLVWHGPQQSNISLRSSNFQRQGLHPIKFSQPPIPDQSMQGQHVNLQSHGQLLDTQNLEEKTHVLWRPWIMLMMLISWFLLVYAVNVFVKQSVDSHKEKYGMHTLGFQTQPDQKLHIANKHRFHPIKSWSLGDSRFMGAWILLKVDVSEPKLPEIFSHLEGAMKWEQTTEANDPTCI